jgi:hypothetical protein
MKKIILAAVFVTLVAMLRSQQPASVTSLNSLKFLTGKWVGEGGGDAGAGSGYFTFESSLQGKALLRKNHAEYPAGKDHPGYVHDDLMIVYAEPSGGQLQAFYTDSEGHVIRYTVDVASDGKTVVFLSEPQPSAPGYRLTYVLTGPDKLALTFELAPPGKQFHKFLEGKMRRAAAAD